MGDAFDNFVVDPAKGAAVDQIVEGAGLDEALDMYNEASDDAFSLTGTVARTGRFIYNNFFA